MENNYQFNREYMIKTIWYIQSLLKDPNISRKTKIKLKRDMNVLKNLFEKNYNIFDNISSKVPTDLEKLKRISLNKMRIVYKTLGVDLINWLLELDEEGIFDIDKELIKQKTNLELSNQAELTLENYSIHSKKYLSAARPIVLSEGINRIEEVYKLKEASYLIHFYFLKTSFIVVDPTQHPWVLNHEVQHSIETDLKYITHNLYDELGPHYFEMLFLDVLYDRQGYLLSGDYGAKIDDAQYFLDFLYEYLSCILIFARNNFDVSLDYFLETIMMVYDVSLEDTISIIKEELVTNEQMENMGSLSSSVGDVQN